VVLLVTSREPLHIAGEREYPLSTLAESPAVELFTERATAITPTFDADHQELIELCDRVDRLPLAIELAAARTKSFSVKSLLERIDERLPLLTSRRRDVDERQRTLRATIEWSYDLLDDDDRDLFARLSVFAGSFDATAAQAVCAADLDALDSLVDKSLLRSTHDKRFFMLETIREFALERFAASAEYEGVCRRQADLALKRARCPVDRKLRIEWRASVDLDYPNFRAALEWLRGQRHDDFLRLASRLGDYWDVRLQLAEGRYWLEQALGTPGTPSGVVTRERARSLASLAHIRWRQGDLDAARSLVDAAEAAAHELADEALLADSHSYRGGIEYTLGNLDAARVEYTNALTIHRAHGARAIVAVMEHDLGLVELSAKEYAVARRHLEESLRVSRDFELDQYEAGVLASIGYLEFLEGDVDRAESLLREGLRLTLERGGVDEGIAHDVYILAAVTAIQGRVEQACTLIGACDAAFDRVGMTREPPAERARDDVLRRGETELGGKAAKHARAHGGTFTVVDAIRYALSVD
jgi:tetratricopeptide (TPR) repeat protein